MLPGRCITRLVLSTGGYVCNPSGHLDLSSVPAESSDLFHWAASTLCYRSPHGRRGFYILFNSDVVRTRTCINHLATHDINDDPIPSFVTDSKYLVQHVQDGNNGIKKATYSPPDRSYKLGSAQCTLMLLEH